MAVSFAKCDLSFLKSPASKKHLAGIQRDNKRRAAQRAADAAMIQRSDLPAPTVMSDIKPFVSPVDRTVISSRSILARHNRANNVRQSGDLDYKAEIAKVQAYHAEIAKPQEGINFSWQPAKS